MYYIESTESMTTCLHLYYSIEMDTDLHRMFFLKIDEYKALSAIPKRLGQARSGLKSHFKIHRLGYCPREDKSNYTLKNKNFDVFPHKFLMENEIKFDFAEDFKAQNSITQIRKFAFVYKYRRKKPHILLDDCDTVLEYEYTEDLGLKQNPAIMLEKIMLSVEKKNLSRFLLAVSDRPQLRTNASERIETTLNLFGMMDGYYKNNDKLLTLDKLMNRYFVPASKRKNFLKFELEELRKQLKEQKYPITIDEGEKNRLETNLLEKKRADELKKKQSKRINNMTAVLLNKKLQGTFDFFEQTLLLRSNKRKNEDAESNLEDLYALIDLEDDDDEYVSLSDHSDIEIN